MTEQLTLALDIIDETTFDNFWCGANTQMVHEIEQALFAQGAHAFFYLWGADGAGKSHVAQATCYAARNQGLSPIYLDFSEYTQWQPDIFEGLEQYPVLCFDNIAKISGNTVWEVNLFHLYNRIRDAGRLLLVTADVAPFHSAMVLPDLRSRLAWGSSYHLQPLADHEMRYAMQWRASLRGMNLSDDVAVYIMKHARRNMRSLFRLLDHLEKQSLQAKRRLTIPFVRKVLAQQETESI